MAIQLHISRVLLSSRCAIYHWSFCSVAENITSGTEHSIEACLIAAVTPLTNLIGDLQIVEILYRKVALGSFPVSQLEDCPAEVTDLLLDRYDQIRSHA